MKEKSKDVERLNKENSEYYMKCVIEEEYQIARTEKGYYIINMDTSSYEQY